MDLSRQFSLEQYRILLEVCGLDVQERPARRLGIKHPVLLVEFSEVFIGRIFRHNSQSLSVREILKLNEEFIHGIEDLRLNTKRAIETIKNLKRLNSSLKQERDILRPQETNS